MLGWTFIWGYLFFFISWKLKLISIIFWEDLPFFSDVFFLLLTHFLKNTFCCFCATRAPFQVPRWSPKSPSPTQPREGCVTSEVLIYLVDCASSPDPYVDFLILQREVQAYFVPFLDFEGKGGWLTFDQNTNCLLKTNQEKYGDRDSDLNLRISCFNFCNMPFCRNKKWGDLPQKTGTQRTSPFLRPFPLKWPSSLVQWWQRSVIWSQKIPCPKLKPGRKNRQMGQDTLHTAASRESPESLKQP